MKQRNMEPRATNLKSSGQTVCSPQRQWEFVYSYSARGAIGNCEAFCGNTTANHIPSLQATRWLIYWVASAHIFQIRLPWEIHSGSRSLRHF
jgi:hypothetical protein